MRVCIVEDNGQLLDNLSMLLRGEPGIEVTGGFRSAEDALAQTNWANVDVLLADIDLPGISGVDLIRTVKDQHPSVNSMAYTIYEDRATVFSAIRAGACGYLLKGSSPRELIESLRELHEGGSPMSPSIARKVILTIHGTGLETPAPDRAGLSEREVLILRQIEKGLSYKEIAQALHISPHTVHTHIKNIYEKVQAHDRADALRRARNLGVL